MDERQLCDKAKCRHDSVHALGAGRCDYTAEGKRKGARRGPASSGYSRGMFGS